MDRESSSVVSLVLEPVDGRPLTVPLPGQFVVLRLRPKPDAPPVLRSYSLSDLPDAGRYRITIRAPIDWIAHASYQPDARTARAKKALAGPRRNMPRGRRPGAR
jgi:ferredoxin-NADP reductase